VIPTNCRYLESHEWARQDGDVVVVGITDFAVKHLTDLVYIDLPDVGETIEKGGRFGEIESVKAVSDLNSPIAGEIVAVNSELADNLDRIAQDPYGQGWMIKVRPSEKDPLSGMLDAAAYQKVIESEG
jgi:glycine cleavage system H protein